jgi:EmrB/QacA subfamily drug resistance transporter
MPSAVIGRQLPLIGFDGWPGIGLRYNARHAADQWEQFNVKIERKWWALVSVGSGVLLSTIDGSIVNIALNTLVSVFDSNLHVVEWVALAYLLTLVSSLLIMGRLADLFGRRRIYATGFLIFTASSVLCGLAPSIEALIGFRVIQGVGAAMLQGVGPALLVSAFPSSERGAALGAIGSFVAVGILTGPVLGGILLSTLGWQSIFYVNVPIGLLGSLLSLRVLPQDSADRPVAGFDLIGAFLLMMSLLSLTLGLTEGPLLGWLDARVMTAWIIGLAAFIGFLAWERFTPHPMVNLQMFRRRVFSGGLLTAGLLFVGTAFNLLLTPLLLQLVFQFDLRQTGLMLMALPSALSVTAPISGRLSDRFGSQRLTTIGLLLVIAALFSLSREAAVTQPVWLIVSLVTLGCGMGLFQGPNNSAIMGSAPPAALGVAGSLTAVVRTLGQMFGIALAGAVLADAIYRSNGAPVVPITAATADQFAAAYRLAMGFAAALVAVTLAVSILMRHRQPTVVPQR